MAPFVEAFDIDLEECEKQTFESFNDFFIRKLKPEARPVGGEGAVLPADGRYWVCESVSRDRDFAIKGQRLTMEELLGEPVPEGGTAVFGRLAPVDCHRFVFPVSGKASAPRLINGPLYSVNPVALRHNIQILSTNKRYVTEIESPQFGTVKMVEVGATCVGSVHSTYRFDSRVERGQEKGYFSFGGSAIILLFEPGRIRLENDLLTHSATFHETRCLMNQPLGAPPSLPPS